MNKPEEAPKLTARERIEALKVIAAARAEDRKVATPQPKSRSKPMTERILTRL